MSAADSYRPAAVGSKVGGAAKSETWSPNPVRGARTGPQHSRGFGPGTIDRHRDASENVVGVFRGMDEHLDHLSEALEGSGIDLAAVMSVLVDDLTAAIPSFLGLTMAVYVDGELVTLDSMNSRAAEASMYLPLGAPPNPGSHVVFYAGEPGAFVELAADAGATDNVGGRIVLDAHLPKPAPDRDGGLARELARRSELHQAIGALIYQGTLPEDAYAVLEQQASAAGTSVQGAAAAILADLPTAVPRDPAG